ncbi:glycerol-3-phosphate acyltransferase PlsY [Thermotomaculum hydrothermale]|uniref:Glycerol-3-phosphate acyltransferase n=1 Tax=Thermotomaculum hydrothermale TaxID=981385 RepID=A0A7R6SZA5_9BACT|nr:glycerol-3-phosphate 1-O-acyltransferase PlsY [Thermotomaculum hydrothermale]BBB32552.1 glycerol-3-phosphate acyltransferase PlsY [Thermotomaculum hydrothermale]
MKYLFALFFSYILGSIPFSFLIAYFCGNVDLRKSGSGNVGATNLYRFCGIKYAFFGFLFDFLKGFFALYISQRFLGINGLNLILTAFAVILGHVFPVFLYFKGGKGVSTTAGVLFFLDYRIFIIIFSFFWLIYFWKKIVSLASVLSALLLIILSILFFSFGILSLERAMFFGIIGFLIIVFHRNNLKRLIKSEEKRVNE